MNSDKKKAENLKALFGYQNPAIQNSWFPEDGSLETTGACARYLKEEAMCP